MLLHPVRPLICLALIVFAISAMADPVDDYMEVQMSRQHIAGAAVAVIKNGRVVKQSSYGLANIELQAAVTSESVFKIGSLSKQIIATGVMLLENEGKLKLDDPVEKYIPESPLTWANIRIRHLLSHTSGLVREAPAYDSQKIQSDLQVIKSAYSLPLIFSPGERFEYSNLGYFVLAEIIRVATGQSWSDYFTQRMFRPLGMQSTRITDSTSIIPNRADGYVYTEGVQQNAPQQPALRPSGAFMSNLSDLVKWNAALDAGRLLPSQSLGRMWAPATLNGGGSAGYGFGWYIETISGHRIIRHGGSISGFRAEFSKFVDDKASVIVLTNAALARTDAIALGIANHYIPNLTTKHRLARLGRDELQAYAGEYQSAPGEAISISANASGIDASIPHFGPPISFSPESRESFYSEDDLKLSLVFTRDRSGQVIEISVRSDGVEKLHGKRSFESLVSP